MKKRFNHSFTFFLSIFVFLFCSLPIVQAKTYVTSGWNFNYNWTCGGMETGAYFTMDGTKVFCVEPHIIYKPNQRYEVVNTRPSYISEAKAEKLSLISYYGTKYYQTERHYAATQSLIWMELGESEAYSVFKVNGSSVKPEMNQILSLVDTHYLTPSFSNQTFTLEVGKTLEIEDTYQVLERFSITPIEGINITKENNKLLITATQDAPTNATIQLSNNADCNDGSTMYYKIPGTSEGNGWQICAKFYVDKPVNSSFSLNVIHYENPIFEEVQVTKKGFDEGTVNVTKTDYITQQALEGVSFSIHMDEAILTDHITTDSNGKLSIPFKKEYQAQSDLVSYITNYDAISPKQQAEYQSLFKTYEEAYEYASNQAINRLNKLIEEASYTFIAKEKQPRYGYYSSNEPIVITTSNNEVLFNVQNNYQTIDIELTKVDEDTLLPIEGVIFGLYAKNDIVHPDGKTGIIHTKDHLVATFPKTDIQGKTRLQKLYLGNYYVKELETPLTYPLNCESIDIPYSNSNESTIVIKKTITNKKNQVKFEKIDSEKHQSLSGAHLQLVNQSGRIIDQWTTSSKAHVIDGLERNQTYTLLETAAPEGYLLANPITFTVNDVQTITMINEYIYGKVTFNKVGEVFQNYKDGFVVQPLEGSEISIYNNQDEFICTLQSNNSIVLPYGKYYALETTVPNGYIQNNQRYDFNISSTDEIILTIENKLPTFTLQLTKQFEDNASHFSDVLFGIYTLDDQLIASCPLNEKGQLTDVPKLPYGSYYLKELTTNENYILDETHYPFTLEYIDKDTENILIDVNNNQIITNHLKRATLVVMKKGEFNQPLNGASFNLMNEQKETIASNTTDQNGRIVFNNLLLGTYYIQEIVAPSGYMLNDEIIEINLNEDYEITLSNQPILSSTTGDYQMIIPLSISSLLSFSILIYLKKKKGRSLL